jgi:hypothetical protein
MALEGKGFFIWQIPKCENGNANNIAARAQEAGLSHVLIKVANDIYAYNYDWKNKIDLCPPVVQALKARGIQVWGWHYLFGNNPTGEADIAARRIRDLKLDGYVLDAEGHYKQVANNKKAAEVFMQRLRSNVGSAVPIALSSYRYPSQHPEIPYGQFLDKCDYNMPQVYWIHATNAGAQLSATKRDYENQGFGFRPLIPTGAAFTEHGWTAKATEVKEFLDTARALNLTAANFWEWHNCRDIIDTNVWETIKNYNWAGGVTPPTDITGQYIAALNSLDVEKIVGLYAPTAVHVTSARTISGTTALKSWFTQFTTQLLPNGSFVLTGYSGSGSSRHLTWTAESARGKVLNGNDTFGLTSDGKITYHYSFFTIT